VHTSAEAFEAARLRLARTTIAGGGTLDGAFARATEISAATLGVERVGIWIFERGGDLLHCVHQFTLSSGEHTSGETLARSACRLYVASLEEHRSIVASDVRVHPLTKELGAYFEKHRIASLLDAPVFRSGDVVGVVCHEHTGPPRSWTERDQSLASALADLVALMFELAARQQAEEQLRKAEARLKQAQKLEAIGLLAGGLSHDFNNVLAIISNQATLLQAMARDRPDLQTGLDVIAGAAERGARLTRRLLGMTRSEPRAPMLVEVEAALADLIPVLSAAAGPLVTLTLDRGAARARVRATANDLERILLNLVTNARDAMPSGGTISIRTRREPVRDDDQLGTGDFVVIEVADTGVGMSPETAARAFEPLFTTKADGKGTGLGLAIVASIVHECGGAIRVESAPGKGSVFRVFLPRAS
jgi:signal transduction histidine kinase